MILLLCGVSFAQTPAPSPAPASKDPHPDKVIRAAVDAMYGKSLPTDAVCIQRSVALPAHFTGSPVAVGVKRGARGCVLVGVMVAGKLVPPPGAAVASLDAAAWAGRDPAAKEADLAVWTDEVLLAFAQPDAAEASVAPKASKTAVTVTRGYLRRAEHSHTSLHATGTWTFGLDGNLTGEPAEKVDKTWVTTTYTRKETLTGLTEEAVVAGLEQKGNVIKGCFQKAWDTDLAVAGRVVLGWNVAGGKTNDIALVSKPGEVTPSKSLVNCYGNAVNGVTWPEGTSGKVVWVFAILRDEVAPP